MSNFFNRFSNVSVIRFSGNSLTGDMYKIHPKNNEKKSCGNASPIVSVHVILDLLSEERICDQCTSGCPRCWLCVLSFELWLLFLCLMRMRMILESVDCRVLK